MADNHVTLHQADAASPHAGKWIGRIMLPGDESHVAVVPDTLTVGEAYDYLVADFETTSKPIVGTLEELDIKRRRVVVGRDHDAMIAAREAAEAEARATEARERADRLNATR